MKELDMFPPKTVYHSQGDSHDPRIVGAVQSPAGSPTHFTNIGCSFSMCFPVSTSTPCTSVLTSHDTTLHTFAASAPIDRDASSFANGPLIFEGAAIQFLTDITTSVNKPTRYEIDVMLNLDVERSLVGTPNYGSLGEDLFDNITFDITTNLTTGTDNAIIGPGADVANLSPNTKFSLWTSDTTWTASSFLRAYVARSTDLILRVTTERTGGTPANINLDLNVFVWGIMLPPLRNP